MALQLAYETSGVTCGVSLHEDDTLLGEYSLFIKNIHDAALADLTQQLIRMTGISFHDIHFVSISAGPGSFTGLRIGYSFVKGLIFRTQMQCISVPTLHGIANAASEFAHFARAQSILSIVHSHKNLFYCQHFNNEAHPIEDIKLISSEQVKEIPNPDSIVVCGPGAIHFENFGKQLSGLNRLTPRFIGKLGAEYFAQHRITDIMTAEPLYAQDFVPVQSA